MGENNIIGNKKNNNYTSSVEFHHYELNWTIENFEMICGSVKTIESPKFPSNDLAKSRQWFLEFKPTELIENSTKNFFITLKNTNKQQKYLNAVVSFYSKSEIGSSLIFTISIDYGTSWSMSGSELFKKFGKAIAKVVLVKCNISVIGALSTVEEEPPIKRRKCKDPMKDLTSLLSNENFKDVTFKLEDKEFTAHKAILAIQSPVFAAMFNSKMSEEQTSIVEIKDVKPKIFQQMLNFVYNVEINDLDNKALELFYVAEKYQLEELKTNCINSLHKNLSAETVIKTLEMADFYSLSELKFECLKLLTTEWEVISETNEFETLIQNQPYLTVEVVNIRKKLDKKENAESNKSLNLPFAFRD